ncbi:OprO/OprP family phosphate-selective porin [Aquisphaera giovannonii]|nr:porin [Aquisphaera giovannonii]
MEEAYRAMEESNRRIQRQYDRLQERYDDLSRRVGPGPRTGDGNTIPAAASWLQEPPAEAAREGLGAEGMGGRTAPGPGGVGLEGFGSRGVFRGMAGFPPTPSTSRPGGPPGAGLSSRAATGIGAQGTEGRVFSPETEKGGEEKLQRRTAKVEFAEGLELSSSDDEFKLTFHNLTQAEYRAFPASQEGILQSQFFIPRQRWYFTGRATRNVEYYTVINRGYGSLDLLDAFITYRFDERLRLRVGRMKTPYLYEYYSIAEGDLVAPERSIYAGNLAGNRQDGLMALGELGKGRMGYAVGVFNGPRRSFQDYNGAKDVIGYVNTRPFLGSRRLPRFDYLNVGGSFDVGNQNNPTQPQALRTANDETTSPTADTLSPTFLQFNNNVIEYGQRTQWAGHMAWFYNSFTLLAEYAGGDAGYATTSHRVSTYIPYNGYFVQASYFLTGEHVTRRVNMIKPKKDFSLAQGKFGLGAIEAHARLSELTLSPNLFRAGFADPNLYTNHAWATDIGFNWYLNFYTRLFLDWQHSEFGQPVVMSANRLGLTRDLFWVRFQVFF